MQNLKRKILDLESKNSQLLLLTIDNDKITEFENKQEIENENNNLMLRNMEEENHNLMLENKKSKIIIFELMNDNEKLEKLGKFDRLEKKKVEELVKNKISAGEEFQSENTVNKFDKIYELIEIVNAENLIWQK